MAGDRVEIHSYRPEWKDFFRTINEPWLIEFFSITDEDAFMLANPQKIVEDGGAVLFATLNDVPVGTCALINEGHGIFDLVKMGVNENVRGRGVGTILMDATIKTAKELGAVKITLDTSTKLPAAISLYKKAGFIQTSEMAVHPVFKRKTFKMELVLE